MPVIYLFTARDVELLKQKARELKREKNIPHHEALNLVAQSLGLNHWHHVCESVKDYEPTLTAYNSGCIVAMDWKESDSFRTSDGVFIADRFLNDLCQNDLLDYFSNLPDEEHEDGLTLKETMSERHFNESFSEFCDELVYFRLNPASKTQTLKQALRLVRTRSFWPPRFIWLKKELHYV